MTPNHEGIAAALHAALIDARRARDRRTAAVFQSALAAIDNATAVPAPDRTPAVPQSEHIAGTAGPLGAGEVPRAAVTEQAARDIVAGEVSERRAAAREYAARGDDAAAAQMREEADLLARILGSG